MKNVAFFTLLLAGFFFSSTATPPPAVEVQWMSWEEAIQAMEKEPRKLFVDVYTDWCGWCKRMDATTFSDPEVVSYLNENYYAIKLDAEQKPDITYKGQTFKFVASGRRGYHELAAALLQGKMSYPSVVYLNEQEQLITVSPGYKQKEQMLKELRYIGGDHFMDTKWEDFK